jgi:hypothetical protein
MIAKLDDSKEKTEAIGATKPAHLDSITITFDSDGSISFGNDMEDAYVETTYERNKGPKIVNRINLPTAEYESNLWHFVRKKYDKIFAVDTNSFTINGHNVSVTAVVELRQDFISKTREAECYWRFCKPFCIEVREPKESPEKLGWFLALDQLEHQLRWAFGDRTAMIVDHDLSAHPQYNDRTKPIFRDLLLPQKVRLHYASSDTGRGHPFNKALAVADSISSQVFKAIRSGKLGTHISSKNPHELYEAIRIVHAEEAPSNY